jgi:hypothetical protein
MNYIEKMHSINDACTVTEKVFNICNSLPIVATVTSPLRTTAGLIQSIFAACVGLGLTIAVGIEGLKSQPNEEKIHKFKIIQEFAFHHAYHGLLNVIRGLGESLVASVGYGIFNALTFLPLNLMQDPEFSPIKKYKVPAAGPMHLVPQGL